MCVVDFCMLSSFAFDGKGSWRASGWFYECGGDGNLDLVVNLKKMLWN